MSGSDSAKESSGGENAAATTTVAKASHLQEEIVVLVVKVLDLPGITEWMPVEQRRSVANAKRSLLNKILEHYSILEGQRVREYVDEAKELGLIGPPDAVECPFCFEDISEDILKSKTVENGSGFGLIFDCCGKVCCLRCADKLPRTRQRTCPFCRSKLGLGAKKAAEQAIERAQSGDATSQCNVATLYLSGSGVAKDMNKAMYWFMCAALQGYEQAQTKVGLMYMRPGSEQSFSEAERFLTMAAKKSCPLAQLYLGKVMIMQGRYEESTMWFMLSASQGSVQAQKLLASSRTENRMRSFYWFKKLALAGDEDSFYHFIAPLFFISLKGIDKDSFDFSTMVKEVGRNPIPEILFWLRKSASVKDSEFKVQVAKERSKYESMTRERCSGCWELAESFNDRMKACRCQAAFYCSKKCQIDHWTGGHLLDCSDKDGNFH